MTNPCLALSTQGLALSIQKEPDPMRITDKEMKTIHIVKDRFHGEWNYTIAPSGVQ